MNDVSPFLSGNDLSGRVPVTFAVMLLVRLFVGYTFYPTADGQYYIHSMEGLAVRSRMAQ